MNSLYTLDSICSLRMQPNKTYWWIKVSHNFKWMFAFLNHLSIRAEKRKDIYGKTISWVYLTSLGPLWSCQMQTRPFLMINWLYDMEIQLIINAHKTKKKFISKNSGLNPWTAKVVIWWITLVLILVLYNLNVNFWRRNYCIINKSPYTLEYFVLLSRI